MRPRSRTSRSPPALWSRSRWTGSRTAPIHVSVRSPEPVHAVTRSSAHRGGPSRRHPRSTRRLHGRRSRSRPRQRRSPGPARRGGAGSLTLTASETTGAVSSCRSPPMAPPGSRSRSISPSGRIGHGSRPTPSTIDGASRPAPTRCRCPGRAGRGARLLDAARERWRRRGAALLAARVSRAAERRDASRSGCRTDQLDWSPMDRSVRRMTRQHPTRHHPLIRERGRSDVPTSAPGAGVDVLRLDVQQGADLLGEHLAHQGLQFQIICAAGLDRAAVHDHPRRMLPGRRQEPGPAAPSRPPRARIPRAGPPRPAPAGGRDGAGSARRGRRRHRRRCRRTVPDACDIPEDAEGSDPSGGRVRDDHGVGVPSGVRVRRGETTARHPCPHSSVLRHVLAGQGAPSTGRQRD